ncbi:MAG: HAD-IC family P-type ATPase [Hyphomicrobiaceae bacterium]
MGLPSPTRRWPDATSTLARLRRAGFTIELLSGDTAPRVAATAREVGISRAAATQSPRDKIVRLEQLKADGHRVLMIGDGLNDAPALAAGYASLSPSTAADVGQTASDAIFQGDSLEPVVEILGVAREARRLALQNFAIAIGYNALFVPLAMAGLVNPLIAAIAMSTSSIVVTLNAVRLRSMTVAPRTASLSVKSAADTRNCPRPSAPRRIPFEKEPDR